MKVNNACQSVEIPNIHFDEPKVFSVCLSIERANQFLIYVVAEEVLAAGHR